jgi:hypothetical protein
LNKNNAQGNNGGTDFSSNKHIFEFYLQELWPEVMYKVDDETLDVGAILILISHDHQATVTESFDRVVLLAELKPLINR